MIQEKGREQFVSNKHNLCLGNKKTLKMRKTDIISFLLGSIKCFPINFSTFKDTLDGSLMELVS
jgi:hypothetical protein